MSMPSTNQGQRAEDQIAGNPVRCNDQTTGPDRIFDQDFAMHRVAQTCH